MDVLFTIGEMAAMNGISKQTLIFYDKENVFKPKFQDSSNLYRYYTADQLEELDSILTLREMGLSLKEIREHMWNRSPERAIELLKKQEKIVKEKINRLTAQQRRISRKLQLLNNHENEKLPFEIKMQDSRLLAYTQVKEPNGLLQVDIALKELLKQASENNAEHFYQIGDTINYKELKNHKFLNFQYAILPIAKSNKNLKTIIQPQGKYATAYHYGPYTTMGETYEFMLRQIDLNNYKIAGDAYEFCVLDNLTSISPKGYCTQLQILVE